MEIRRLSGGIVLSLVLAGCAGAPGDVPASDSSQSGPDVVLEEARSVATDLEQRQIDLEAQVRDPFSRP